MIKNSRYNVAMLAVVLTAIFWGAGFVMNDKLLQAGVCTSLINTFRFLGAAIIIGLVFCRQININKNLLLFGALCGAILFVAFEMQITALKYTTAGQNAFFSAGTIVFVPFLAWIVNKKMPKLSTWIGVVVAVIGFVIIYSLNEPNGDSIVDKQNELGNFITVLAAILFSMQIVVNEWVLAKYKLHALSLAFVQIAVAGVLFLLYFLIFHLSTANLQAVDWSLAIFPLFFIVVLGTAFAYPSQIKAQQILPASTVSLVLSQEAVVGLIISVIVGSDVLTWQLVLGGVLITVAVFIVELIPQINTRK